MIDPIKIRERFPFFKNNPEVMYFDSAATSQKPDVVIQELNNFYTKFNSNSDRGSYKLSSYLSKQVEDVRSKIANFIGSDENEIIFTSGASEGFNKIIQALCFGYLKDGDEILYSPYDHKSFILPWFGMQKILKKFGVSIKLIPYDVRMTGGADIEDIFSKVSSRTKVISITHIHNIFGSDADIHKLKELREKEILIFADVTQSVGHIDVNVNNLGVDILAFSGHKMFASQGVGVLYVNKNLHDNVATASFGGGDGVVLDGDEVKINKLALD